MEPNKSDNINNENSSKPLKKESPDFNQKLKSLNLSQLYTKGSYLDVYDAGDSIWRVAKVIDLNQNYVKISYDGWKSVYDDVIFCVYNKTNYFSIYVC